MFGTVLVSAGRFQRDAAGRILVVLAQLAATAGDYCNFILFFILYFIFKKPTGLRAPEELAASRPLSEPQAAQLSEARSTAGTLSYFIFYFILFNILIWQAAKKIVD